MPSKVPNRLLQRPPQPDNDSDGEESNDEAEEFEGWIDNLYGFIHMVNSMIAAPQSKQFMVTLTLEKMLVRPYNVPDLQIDEPNYDIIPRSTLAVSADK